MLEYLYYHRYFSKFVLIINHNQIVHFKEKIKMHNAHKHLSTIYNYRPDTLDFVGKIELCCVGLREQYKKNATFSFHPHLFRNLYIQTIIIYLPPHLPWHHKLASFCRNSLRVGLDFYTNPFNFYVRSD